MGIDYAGFEKMLKDFKNLQKSHEIFIKAFLKEIGMRTIAQTKKLTPIDTGELRNRWEVSDVFRDGDELYIVLTNSLEYASFVEDGHMQRRRFVPGKWKGNHFEYIKDYKPPAGKPGGMMLKQKWIPGQHMARISIAKMEQELPARYDKAFKKFLNDLGMVST